jgi:hypothetical protein
LVQGDDEPHVLDLQVANGNYQSGFRNQYHTRHDRDAWGDDCSYETFWIEFGDRHAYYPLLLFALASDLVLNAAQRREPDRVFLARKQNEL